VVDPVLHAARRPVLDRAGDRDVGHQDRDAAAVDIAWVSSRPPPADLDARRLAGAVCNPAQTSSRQTRGQGPANVKVARKTADMRRVCSRRPASRARTR
jgi:hypothetical protein